MVVLRLRGIGYTAAHIIISSGPTHAKRKERNAKCKAQNRAIPTIGWYINNIDSLINRSTNSRSLT